MFSVCREMLSYILAVFQMHLKGDPDIWVAGPLIFKQVHLHVLISEVQGVKSMCSVSLV